MLFNKILYIYIYILCLKIRQLNIANKKAQIQYKNLPENKKQKLTEYRKSMTK